MQSVESSLHHIMSIVGAGHPAFLPARAQQQDCHELVACILLTLHEDMNIAKETQMEVGSLGLYNTA